MPQSVLRYDNIVQETVVEDCSSAAEELEDHQEKHVSEQAAYVKTYTCKNVYAITKVDDSISSKLIKHVMVVTLLLNPLSPKAFLIASKSSGVCQKKE